MYLGDTYIRLCVSRKCRTERGGWWVHEKSRALPPQLKKAFAGMGLENIRQASGLHFWQ